jgi:hypothetical protein
VGDFLRVGSVGVVVIETHDGTENRVLSEEKIQKIMKDTTSNTGGFLDLAETDGGEPISVVLDELFMFHTTFVVLFLFYYSS